jgi:diacylglycerol kinase (ATP)
MDLNKPTLSPLPTQFFSQSQEPKKSVSVSPESGSSSTDNRSQSWQVATNLLVSFQYAWTGITYAFKTQRNFRIHTIIGSLAISLSLVLNLSPVEISIIGLTIGAVMAMELLNTAIESIVDLSVGQSFHELAKIAKDCAAGAVMIFALAAVLVAGVLLLPPLLTVMTQYVQGVGI